MQYAREADLHLRPRPGTNLALPNALTHEIISGGWVDNDYVERHTVGFGELEKRTRDWTPEKAAEICGVPAGQIREAARVIGAAERLLSTALQGVYQSHQASATAVQINNINLLRGMLGKPGCGILQMNGQPTAQNTRETGANGSLPGFRNWQNDAQVEDLAWIWNVDPLTIPHYSEPTHCMQIFRYAEEGSIRFLWIQCTNPRSPCRSCTGSARSWSRSGSSSSCRISSSLRPHNWPTWCCRWLLGREVGHLYEHRPHGTHLREGRRASTRPPQQG